MIDIEKCRELAEWLESVSNQVVRNEFKVWAEAAAAQLRAVVELVEALESAASYPHEATVGPEFDKPFAGGMNLIQNFIRKALGKPAVRQAREETTQ